MCGKQDAHQVTAAVLTRHHGEFEQIACTLEPPRPDEVLVRIVATGMCHTDLAVRDGVLPTALPAVLGHEGSGIVEEIGSEVTSVAPGDHVVLTFLPCSECAQCAKGSPAGCENIGPLNFSGTRPDGSHALTGTGDSFSDRFFGQSSFATHAIANARNVVKVRRDAPLELLGPLGCGVQTGAGTVLNALKVGAGDSIAIFGGGAVGLSAVMAAKLAGATQIIVVDVVEQRLELALELGATETFDGRRSDIVEIIRSHTNGRLAFSIDTTANVQVVRNAVAVLGPMGTCAFVGATPAGTEISLDANDFLNNNKRLMGVIEGHSVPRLFIPRLVDLFMQGKFPMDRLVCYYDFDQINEAADDSEAGKAIKPILRIAKSEQGELA